MPQIVRRRHKRPRPQTSCRVCHQRKVRCNRALPCDQCIKHRCAQDCQFDGIPAKHGDASEASAWESTGSVGHSPEGSYFASDTAATSNLGYLLRPNAASTDQSCSDETTSGKSSEESRLPAHKCLSDSLTRGRTHYSWLLQEFGVLKAHVDRAASDDDADQCNISILTRRKQDLLRQNHFAVNELAMSANVFEELPPAAVACDLVFRYFETFDTVYPVMDREDFGKAFNTMLADPSSVSICFVMQVLMMQALANATYSEEQAPIARASTLRWLDLAAATPGSATEIDELDVEIIRLFALVILAGQVLKYNETRDYVFTSTCARAAMTLGLHRITHDDATALPGRRNLHSLWEMIQDLEVQASLAAGMPPSTSLPRPSQARAHPDIHFHRARAGAQTADRTSRSSSGMSNILSLSLQVRHKIVSTLNSEHDLHFEKVVQLSRELTRSMAPVSTIEHLPDALKTFEYQYVSFVYGRFLVALHRPFATLNDPAFYWSRTLCVRLSKQYVQELCSNSRNPEQPDTFGTLLVGHGSMFRVEALQAIMMLCYELYRDEDDDMLLDSMVQSEEEGKAGVRSMLEDLLPFGQKMMQTYDLEGRSFLLPFMVLAHLDTVRQFPRGSEAYNESMARAATAAVGQCFSFWSQLDLRQAGFT